MKQCSCFFPGFVGLFSALFLWPGFFILHYSHYETLFLSFPGFLGLFSALILSPEFFILHYSHYETLFLSFPRFCRFV